MRDVLEALAAGELTVEEAQAQLRGYVHGDAGRFDASRVQRSGVPEAILAPGKSNDEVADLARMSLETTDRAIVTRLGDERQEALTERLGIDDRDGKKVDGKKVDGKKVDGKKVDAKREGGRKVTIEIFDRSEILVAHTASFEPPTLDAGVGIVTAGTSDAVPAGEAAVIVSEMGASVERIDDVGVAALDRMLDQLPTLREQDVLIVAAGREGALPTVIAGLVDVPVIGLPVSTGYGEGGNGKAALVGMLQSCTALSVVNIDAGFTAGAQAGLIARAIDGARGSG